MSGIGRNHYGQVRNLYAQIALIIAAGFAGSTWAEAETIDVKYYGKLDLATFACTDVSEAVSSTARATTRPSGSWW
jgi:hypothetical protein